MEAKQSGDESAAPGGAGKFPQGNEEEQRTGYVNRNVTEVVPAGS
jgi:hypothetical protein